MKKLIGSLILGGLFSIGLLALSYEKTVRPDAPLLTGEANQSASSASIREANQAASLLSIDEVLRAHSVPQNPAALSTFSAEAVRLTSRPPGIDPPLASFFERHVSVVMAGEAYRRHTSDPSRLREQFDLFDGSAIHHAAVEQGRLVEAADSMTDSESEGVEFGVKTLGLVPILRQLSDPTTEAVYLGSAAYGQDKFEVKTSGDRWTIFTNREHLICRLEAGNRTIEYADYRSVDGIRLPFIQRLSIGGRLLQEIVFTRIDLNPALPAGCFSRESLSKELAR
jgi:hypothetical protein